MTHADFLQQRTLAYAYFHGRVSMTVSLASDHLYSADEAFRELRDAVAHLERALEATKQPQAELTGVQR